jgi:glutamate-1-semialdehyde aminotransferase
VSGTFAGEILSLAAARAVIKYTSTTGFLEDLVAAGTAFQRLANERLEGTGIRFEGYGTRGVISGDPTTRAIFMQECASAGLLFGPSWFWNVRHSEFESLYKAVLSDLGHRMRTQHIPLRGEVPQPPFAQKARGLS